MLNTPYFKWTYPEENDDPYFDEINSFFMQVDDGVFGLLNTAGNLIIPPSSVVWNDITKQLTWNADFEVPLMSIGFSFLVRFGPDGINRSATLTDGARLVVTVPRTASGNVVGNFAVVTSTQVINNGLFTVGFCRGSKFYANFPQVFS